jgi:tRNA A37 threonylcarbamoyladenosine dehydratase
MIPGWLERTELCIGPERLKILQFSDVLVVGLGGVGAYAAEMICRAGIGSMTIADGDTIQISNRNRQLPALLSTTGRLKGEVMGERLKDINPDLKLTIIAEYLKDDRMIDVLSKGFDYVVDAIDTLSPKVFLLYHSLQMRYRVVSSMGAGGRLNPEEVKIDDISRTTDCTLARTLRKRLHRLGVREGITTVYSPEKVDKTKIIETGGEQNKASIVGTISYMPAVFGIACASVVIRDLAGIER